MSIALAVLLQAATPEATTSTSPDPVGHAAKIEAIMARIEAEQAQASKSPPDLVADPSPPIVIPPPSPIRLTRPVQDPEGRFSVDHGLQSSLTFDPALHRNRGAADTRKIEKPLLPEWAVSAVMPASGIILLALLAYLALRITRPPKI